MTGHFSAYASKDGPDFRTNDDGTRFKNGHFLAKSISAFHLRVILRSTRPSRRKMLHNSLVSQHEYIVYDVENHRKLRTNSNSHSGPGPRAEH